MEFILLIFKNYFLLLFILEEVIYAIISFFGDNSLKLENKMPEIEQSSSININLDIDNLKSNYICILRN